jgi:hypothetical protein
MSRQENEAQENEARENFHYSIILISLFFKCFINLFSVEVLQEYGLYSYFQNVAYSGLQYSVCKMHKNCKNVLNFP